MSMHTRRWSMDQIRASNRAVGHHWFDPDTLAFFDSEVEEAVYEGPSGVFFVSSEQFHNGAYSRPRRWTVRQFDPESGHINTAGPFNKLDRDVAKEHASKFASGAMKPEEIVAE